MTAQIGDKFIFRGDDYSIVAISNPIQFDPKDYGLKPTPRSSACWKGYWCDYHISENGIMLKNLYVYSEDNCYPEINGIKPEAKEGKKKFQYMGHYLYKDLDMFMDYTGKILVGKGFMRDYYIHMGYQRAWAYEVLEELVFESGKLVRVIQHSEMAKKLRDEVDKDINKGKKIYKDIPRFVEKSFSLEMQDKAWWIIQDKLKVEEGLREYNK